MQQKLHAQRELSREELALVYEFVLGRPAGEEEIERMLSNGTGIPRLRRVFFSSREFRQNLSNFVPKTSQPGPPQSGPQGVAVHRIGLRPLAEEKVVFLHLPKCGGTTLHALLQAWYGADLVHQERFNGLYRATAADLAAHCVFSGHYDYYSTTLVPGAPRRITFLRDPLARLVSLYNFHRAHTPEIIEQQNLTLVRWAHQFDIDTYFARPEVRAHAAINNSMVRYLSNEPQVPYAGGPHETRLDVLYEQAAENLSRFDFVGFMDDYDASVARLARILGKPPVETVEKRQVLDDLMERSNGMRRIEKQTPSPETVDRIEELIEYDRLLYDGAREIFGAVE